MNIQIKESSEGRVAEEATMLDRYRSLSLSLSLSLDAYLQMPSDFAEER